MKIFDVFPCYDEQELIRARVHELRHVPSVVHIGMEAATDFRGRPKPLHLAEWDEQNLGRLTIMHCDLPHDPADPWVAERWQRDALLDVLEAARPDDEDLVLTGDADEFVRAAAIEVIARATEAGPVKLGLRMHYFEERFYDPAPWVHAGAFRWKDRPETLSSLRLDFSRPVVPDAGWHLSYWHMSPDRVHQKLSGFAHAELDIPEVHAQVESSLTEGRRPWLPGCPRLARWPGGDMPGGLAGGA